MTDQQKTLWTDEPFYSPNLAAITPAPEVKESAPNVPSQKTLDEWHYRLNEAIEDLRDTQDPVTTRRDLEDVANEIQTYLKG